MKSIFTGILLICLCSVALGQGETAKFYNGSIFHVLHTRGGRYDLYIDFCEFTHALGRSCETDSGNINVTINKRILSIDLEKKTATVNFKTVPVRVMHVGGKLYMSVRSLIRVFQPLLSRKLIYEPTSRVLHLSKEKTVSVSMGTGIDKQSYFLQAKFDSFGKKPTCQRSGSYLILSFQTPYLRLDIQNITYSEAIKNVNVFDHLPDGTSEVHIELGTRVSKHRLEPFTIESGFMVIRFFGEFKDLGTDDISNDSSLSGGIKHILLDPGHGGKDEGARGPSGLKEKHVTLLICRALQRALKNHGYEVSLTREGDYHLPLKVRTGIANNEKADLLLSIHLNAIPKANAWGSETYYLSLDDQFSESESYTVAFENRDISLDQDEAQNDHEEEPGVDLDLILWDLAQTEFLEDSFRVSRYVQEELNILAGTKNRGVKQAPLKVLQGAHMPACLIEVAFISNPEEEKKLRSPAFKSRVVKALTTAIRRYDRDVQDRNRGKNRGTKGQPVQKPVNQGREN